jgi:hypothetical protein
MAVLVFLLGIAIMGAVWVFDQAALMDRKQETAALDETLEGLRDVIETSDELTAKKQQLSAKIETIQEIAADRIIWSRQLYNLSKLAPTNFWYSNIKVDSAKVEVQREVTDPKTKQKQVVSESVSKPVLIVEGYIAEGETGRADLNPFLTAAEQDEEFSSMFRLRPPDLSDTTFEGVDVRQFEVEFFIEPGADES